MISVAGIGFTAPWVLVALIALPILWILLRAVPPAPLRLAFPAVTLLLGLQDSETTADRTPWWLLLLRCAAIAALILAFAGPVLNPDDRRSDADRLLVIADASWASAPTWEDRRAQIRAALDGATRGSQDVAIVLLSEVTPEPADLVFLPAARWKDRLASLAPTAWEPTPAQMQTLAEGLEGTFDTLWISDGIEREGRNDLVARLQSAGRVSVLQSPDPAHAIAPPAFAGGATEIKVIRQPHEAGQTLRVTALGPGPSGALQSLAETDVTFGPGEDQATAALDLPAELRNRIERVRIDGISSAGAVSLIGDGLRRREVALLGSEADREGLLLLSPDHFLSNALAPTVDLLSGPVADILPANPDVIILADVAKLSSSEQLGLSEWVAKGGLLIRFAGPKLAATALEIGQDDPLMPVQLRAGGRSLGGAMSWGSERRLAPFVQGSPFYGLQLPDDVRVTAQVLAQPSPLLQDRTLASLADGTPLVTRKNLGAGQVVLFHITANAEWSNLPISGLFVEMLERLSVAGRSPRDVVMDAADRSWQATTLLDGFGRVSPTGTLQVVQGAKLAQDLPDQQAPPGIYQSADAFFAHNVISADRQLRRASWPLGTDVSPLMQRPAVSLTPPLLVAGLIMVLLDALIAMAMMGRVSRNVTASILAAALALGAAGLSPQPVAAQTSDDLAVSVTSQTVLAHVLTGVPEVDRIAKAGLTGLSDSLYRRTSIEPADPIGIDLETDDLALFPLLYWPVTPEQTIPSAEAYARLNAFLRGGGMILFDTRDADRASFGAASANASKLQALALPLEIPPLEPVPGDHVLTRSFYLLQSFPGRHTADIWVEAAPPGATQTEGMPFRNLNDNVTPVVIGGNDWAAAWAVGPDGNWLLPVGRGAAGERQREFALRFGINLVMHVLTGNYKSDQVHVPALLNRLGQ